MGNVCQPLSQIKKLKFLIPEKQLWEKIRDYCFDTADCFFLAELQHRLSDINGADLEVDSLAPLLLQFKRFLFLLAMKNELESPSKFQIVPSPQIDRVWRVLISLTPIYEKFCEQFFDQYLYRDSEEICNIDDYTFTLLLYKRFFGRPLESYWPRFSSQLKLQQYHESFLFIDTNLFVQFLERIRTKYSGRQSADLQGVLRRSLTQIKKKLNRQNEALFQKGKCIEEEELQLTRDPFGSFAKLDRSALSQFDMDFASEFGTIESRPRYHSFDLSRTTRINPLPPSTVSNAVWHNHLDRTANTLKKQRRNKEEAKLKELEGQDQIIKLLKTNWKSLLLKFEDTLQAEELPFFIQNKFSSQFSHSMVSTNLVFREYKRYLKLCAIKKDQVVFVCPTLIKWMWEYHVVQSLDYKLFCKHNFNQKLNPAWFLLKNKETLFRAYSKTLEAYELLFKHPAPQSVWEKPEEFLKKQKQQERLYDITGILHFHFKKNETRVKGHKLRIHEKNKTEAFLAISGMTLAEEPEEEIYQF